MWSRLLLRKLIRTKRGQTEKKSICHPGSTKLLYMSYETIGCTRSYKRGLGSFTICVRFADCFFPRNSPDKTRDNSKPSTKPAKTCKPMWIAQYNFALGTNQRVFPVFLMLSVA